MGRGEEGGRGRGGREGEREGGRGEGESIVGQHVVILVISHLARFEGATAKSRPTGSRLLCLTSVYKFFCGRVLANSSTLHPPDIKHAMNTPMPSLS